MSKPFGSQWIEPDFADFGNSTTCLPSSSKNFTRKASKIKPSRRKTANDGSEFVEFVKKYEPQTKNDLAVHNKKVAEIEQWLKSSRVSNKLSKFLLLIGPSGCGKSATIKILAKEMQLQIMEWSNGQNYHTFNGVDNQMEINYSNQTKDFAEFLIRAQKCSMLKITSTPSSEENQPNTSRLIVVEEFPYAFVLRPESLWIILRQVRRNLAFPIVFICSDAQQTAQHHEQFNWKSLFPKNIQEELGFCSISFNPVSHTSMLKVLRTIMEQQSSQTLFASAKKSKRTDDPLDQIAEASNGDLRSGINSLQFFISDQKCGSAAFKKDSPLLLFRALGKFLYSKRNDNDIQVLNENHQMPQHLSRFSRESELNFDPELIVEQAGVEGDLFNLFLHENYPDFLFDIDSAVEISSILSYSDFLTSRWSTNDQLNIYSNSLVGRSVAFHCYGQKLEKTWKQTRKPAWLVTGKNVRKNMQQLAENFECLKNRFGSALALDIVPYLAKLPHIRLASASQWQAVEDLGRMPVRLKKRSLHDSSFQRKVAFVNQDDDFSFIFDDNDDDFTSKVSASQDGSVADDTEIDKKMLSLIEEYDD